MLCPRCHGTHVILVNGCQRPCPECSGMGEIHCCDGLLEQPDQESGVGGQESDEHGGSGSVLPDS
jgi:hypothetical protein